jgi:hypothetical protein
MTFVTSREECNRYRRDPRTLNLLAWTRPTVWLHIGQSGVRKTASTPSSRSRRATSGALLLNQGDAAQ